LICKIAICDDKVYTEKIYFMVRDYCKQYDTGVIIDVFHEIAPLRDSIESGRCYDIYILDIEMPGYAGMYIAGRMKEVLPRTIVVVVTA
jgi:DNA-binding LytR/AlgR family response regulator